MLLNGFVDLLTEMILYVISDYFIGHIFFYVNSCFR